MKRVSIVIFVCLTVLVISVSAFAANAIKIVINGEEVASAVRPIIQDGSVMVPLRFVSEQFGKDVNWDGANKTASINDDASKPYGSVIFSSEVNTDDIESDITDDDDNINLMGIELKTFYQSYAYEIVATGMIDNLPRGYYVAKLVIKDPENDVIEVTTFPFEQIEDNKGYCIYNIFDVAFEKVGTYTIELNLDGEVLSKAALYCLPEYESSMSKNTIPAVVAAAQ